MVDSLSGKGLIITFRLRRYECIPMVDLIVGVGSLKKKPLVTVKHNTDGKHRRFSR